jgi:hypothetical protein
LGHRSILACEWELASAEGEVAAVIQIVSPVNKDHRLDLQTFAWKAVDLLQQQVNLLVIDPFPPVRTTPTASAPPSGANSATSHSSCPKTNP